MLPWQVWPLLWLLLCINSTVKAETEEANYLNHILNSIIRGKYEKRPFCNAFTGCGKKRSYPSAAIYPLSKRANDEADVTDIQQEPITYNNMDLSEGLSDLIDINAEPAVENVQKQIMSQAKLYEAIKEASREIYRQRNRQKTQRQQQQMEQTDNRE